MRWPHRGQRKSTLANAATMRRRTAGSDGGGGGPVPGCVRRLFFSAEPEMVQEGERQHAHQRMVVQPAPGPALEVIETEFLLHLLVHLLADPALLDRAHQCPLRGVRRVI